MNEQRTIYQAVESRGYAGDWTKDELIGRHLLKLLEETGELAYSVNAPGSIKFWPWHDAVRAGERGKTLFDHGKKQMWEGVTVDLDELKREMVDCAVVLFSLAEVVGIDLVAAAVEKATRDIERGVR